MPDLPASRVGDDIAHSHAGLGMGLGAGLGLLAGVVLVGATIATGGAALAVVAAVGGAMALTSTGGLSGKYIGEASMGPSCGEFVIGSPNVFINGRAAVFTFGSYATCDKDSGLQALATGAATVSINGGLAGRRDEMLACSAKSVPQVSPNVFIGGPSAADPRVQITPEVPQWAVTGLEILGVAGALLALPYSIVALGVAGTIGGGVLGAAGGAGLTMAARPLGEAMGLSETTIRAMEVGGGLMGGALGGGAAARFAQSPLAAATASRLGLSARTPFGAPAATRAALGRMPLRYQGQYATAKATGWRWPNKGWPPDNGAAGPERMVPLPKGTKLDRFGDEKGGYMSPAGESFPARAMRGEPPTTPANHYTVNKQIDVAEADIAPWFDQPGGGKQYRLVDPAGEAPRYSVKDAKRDKYLIDGH